MPPAEKKDSGDVVLQKEQETVIIFDWDDTLLASSFLSGKGYRLDSPIRKDDGEVDSQLRELEQSVVNVLSLALSLASAVHIITNAETGWVQLSAQRFLPAVLPLLGKVKIISARSTYESMYPDAPFKWKLQAMQEKLQCSFGSPSSSNNNNSSSSSSGCNSMDFKGERHVISFGDSHVEREAVRTATRGLTNTRTKSIKFAERPSLEQLRRQLDLIASCFFYITSHAGDLDLQLTVTTNAPMSGVSSPSSNNSNNNNGGYNNNNNSNLSSSGNGNGPTSAFNCGSSVNNGTNTGMQMNQGPEPMVTEPLAAAC